MTTSCRYFFSMPAFSRTAFHLSTSAATNLVNSAGVETCTMTPTFSSCSRIAGCDSTSLSAALVLSTTAGVVAAGESPPFQPDREQLQLAGLQLAPHRVRQFDRVVHVARQQGSDHARRVAIGNVLHIDAGH